jgi:hypothetical protein
MRRQWQDIEAEVDRLRREPALAPDGLPANLFTAIEPADEMSFQAERPWAATADELRSLALRTTVGGHAALAQSMPLQAQREFLRPGDALRVKQCLHDQAEAACIQRHWEVVREYGQWACEMRRQLGDAAGQVDSGVAWALGAYQLGMNEEASGAAQPALEIALQRTLASSRWVLIGWCVLAAAYNRVGRGDDRRCGTRHDRIPLACAQRHCADCLPQLGYARGKSRRYLMKRTVAWAGSKGRFWPGAIAASRPGGMATQCGTHQNVDDPDNHGAVRRGLCPGVHVENSKQLPAVAI